MPISASRVTLADAGITDPQLRASYEICRRLHARHGRTYYLATKLLPPRKRPFVHALYGFARYADDLVDDARVPLADRRRALDELAADTARAAAAGHSTHPVLAAFTDTVTRWDIPWSDIDPFLTSMRMDLSVRDYPTYAELYPYVYGSAAVIGRQMVPILGFAPGADAYLAIEGARDLGIAFQLVNFVRDVGEDLDRGRVYLPADELALFGVDRLQLERRVVTENVRAALAFQLTRVRGLQARAEPMIGQLHPASRPCIQAASTLYCQIADEIERIDYQVFARRARVSPVSRLRIALPAWQHARTARRTWGCGPIPPARPRLSAAAP